MMTKEEPSTNSITQGAVFTEPQRIISRRHTNMRVARILFQGAPARKYAYKFMLTPLKAVFTDLE